MRLFLLAGERQSLLHPRTAGNQQQKQSARGRNNHRDSVSNRSVQLCEIEDSECELSEVDLSIPEDVWTVERPSRSVSAELRQRKVNYRCGTRVELYTMGIRWQQWRMSRAGLEEIIQDFPDFVSTRGRSVKSETDEGNVSVGIRTFICGWTAIAFPVQTQICISNYIDITYFLSHIQQLSDSTYLV